MKLRWFMTCNEHGVKTNPELQYWDIDIEKWLCVPLVECKDWEEDEYLLNQDADNEFFFIREK